MCYPENWRHCYARNKPEFEYEIYNAKLNYLQAKYSTSLYQLITRLLEEDLEQRVKMVELTKYKRMAH